MLIGGIATIGGPAQAVHDETFELDGNVAPNDQPAFDPDGDGPLGNVADPNVDWEDFVDIDGDGFGTDKPAASLPTGFIESSFLVDFETGLKRGEEVALTSDSSTFTTNSKDILDISAEWRCVGAQNVTDKGDLTNVQAAAYRNADGDLILYFAAEKNDSSGANNIGVWFLQDENVACQEGASGNGAPFTGSHVDDDILLVSAFTNGGTTANISAYKWDNGGLVSLGSGGTCAPGMLAEDRLCAITNPGTTFDPPWKAWDKDTGSLNLVAQQQFYEGAINVTDFGLNPCITTFLANTRSSHETTATLYDYAVGAFPVCGDLEVSKYIDADLSGTNNTGDATSGTVVAGWNFTVKGPAPSTTVVCSGTTDSTGVLSCTTGSLQNLTPGQYTITETQQTGFFNTDAADGTAPAEINEASSVSATVTVGVDGGAFAFGNTCYVDKKFQITAVPSTVDSVTVEYRVMTGPHAALTYTTLALDQVGTSTTYEKSVNDTFIQTDTIAWRWYINGDSANKVVGATEAAPESLASSGYGNGCSKLNTDSLDLVTLQGFKYKDVDGNAALDTSVDTPAGGWEFTLKRFDDQGNADPSDDTETVVGSPVLSVTGGANAGRYQFTGVAPGVYRIYETARSGWAQTVPSSPAYRQVTVVLGATSPVAAGNFLNTPTARIDIDVTSLATNPSDSSDAMEAEGISCVKAAGNTNEADLTDADGATLDNDYTSGSVRAGTYTCTVVIIDP